MDWIAGSATSAYSFIYSIHIQLFNIVFSLHIPLTTPMTGASLYLMLFLLKSEPPKKGVATNFVRFFHYLLMYFRT